MILIVKFPSPETNPLNHSSLIASRLGCKRGADSILGNASFKSLEKPQLLDDFNDTIFCNPSFVKCCLLQINKYASLNKI